MDLNNEGGAAAGGEGGANGGDNSGGEGGGAFDASRMFGDGGSNGGDGGDDAGASGSDDGANGGDGAGGGDGAADPDFYGLISSDTAEGDSASLRDWVKSSGIKDVNHLAKIARDNQRAVRESGRIKIPGEDASAEDIAAFHKAIGVPEDAKGYAVEAPKGENGDPLPLNDALIERLSGAAHKAGMPAGAFKAVVEDFIAFQMEELAGIDSEQQAKANDWAKKQGDQRDAKLAMINRAGKALDLTDKDMIAMRNALGADRMLDMFARLGEGISEDVLLGGRSGGGFLPNASGAQSELDAMKADPAIREKVSVPGSAENIRWKRLQDIVGRAANAQAAAG